MASKEKMQGVSATISEAKDRIIVVGNLPQDVKRELLQCLFPEAVKIFMDIDEHRNRRRGVSLVVFPKVKNALFYTDKSHSIKLDSRLLSIRYLGPQSSKTTSGGGSGSSGGGGGSSSSASGGNKPAAAQPKPKPRIEAPPQSNPQPNPTPKESEDDKIVLIQNLPKGIGKVGVLQIIPTAKKVTFKGPPRKSKFESALLEFNTLGQANAVIKKNGQLKVGDHTLYIESMTTYKKRTKNQPEGAYNEEFSPKPFDESKDRGGGPNEKSNQQKMAQGGKGSGSEDKRFVFMSKRGNEQQQSFGPEMGQYEKDLANLFNFPKAGTNPAALQYGLAALENLLSRASKMGMNDLKSLLSSNPRLHQLFAENQDFQPRLQKLLAHNQDFQPQLKRLFAANQVFLPKLQMLIAASKQQQQSKENLGFNMGPLGQFGPHGPVRPQGPSMGPPQASMRPPQGSGRMMQGPGGGPMSMQEQQAFKKEMMARQQRRMYSAARGAADEEEEDNEGDYEEEQEFGDGRNFPVRDGSSGRNFPVRDGSSGPWSNQDEDQSQQRPRMYDDEPSFPFRRRMKYNDKKEDRGPTSRSHKQPQSPFTEEMEEFAEKQRSLYEGDDDSCDRPPSSPPSKRRMYGANEESMYNEDQNLPPGRRQGFFSKGGGSDEFAPPHKRRVIYIDEPERGGPKRQQRSFGGGEGDTRQDYNEGPRMYGGFGGGRDNFGDGGGRDNFDDGGGRDNFSGGGGRDNFGGGGGRDNFGGGGSRDNFGDGGGRDNFGGGSGRDNFGGGGGRDNFGGGSGGGRDNFGSGGGGRDNFGGGGGGSGRDNFGGGGSADPSDREGGGYDGSRNRDYPGSRSYDEFRRGGAGEDDRMGGDGGGRKAREMFNESMDFPNRNAKMFGHNESFHNQGGGGSDNFSGSMMPPQQSNMDTSSGPSVGESKLNYVSYDYNHQHSNVPLSDMEPFSNNSGDFPGGGAGNALSSSMMGQDSSNSGPYDRHGSSMSRGAGGDDSGNQFGQRGMEASGPGFDTEMDQSYSRDDQRPPPFGVGTRNLKSAMRNNSAYRYEDSSGNPEQSRDLSVDFSGNNNNNNNRMPSGNPDSGGGFWERDREDRDTFVGTWRSPLGVSNYQQEREGDMGRGGSGFGEDMSGSRQMDDTANLEQQEMEGSNNFRGNMDFQYGGNARGQSEGGDFSDWSRQRDGENEGLGPGRDSGIGDGGRGMKMGESHDYGHKSSDRYYGGSSGDDRPSYSSRGANKSNNDDIEDPNYVKWGQGVSSMERGTSRERSWMSRGDPGDYRHIEDDDNDNRSKGGYGFQTESDTRGSHMYEDQSGDYRHHDNQSDYPGDGSGGHRNESSFRRGVSFSRDEDLQESSRDDETQYYRSGRNVAFERDSCNYNQDFDDSGNDPNPNVDESSYYGAGMEQNLPDDRDSYRRQERFDDLRMEDDFEQDGSDPPLGWRGSSSKQGGSDPPLGWRNPASKQDGSDAPLGWRNPGSKQDSSDAPLGWRNPGSKQDGSDPPLGWRNHKYFSSSPPKSDPPSSSRRGWDDAESSGWERSQRGSGSHGDRPGGEQVHRRGRSSRSGRSYGRNSGRNGAGSKYGGGGGGGGRGSYGEASKGGPDTGDDKDDLYEQDSVRKVVLSREWKGDAGGGSGSLMRRHQKQSRWN